MKIRNANTNDLDSFVRLYQISYKNMEEYAYTRKREIKWYFKWLMKRDEYGFFVAEIKEPVGFVACDANWISFFEGKKLGEIHELFVDPDYRNRGVGRKLLDVGIEYAKSRGRELIELWVGMTNHTAKEFYKKVGFIESGVWGKWIRMIKEI